MNIVAKTDIVVKESRRRAFVPPAANPRSEFRPCGSRARILVEVETMIVQIVRFKSGLSDAEVLQMCETRAPKYRALKGLKQKYYLRFAPTDELGAVYLWESEGALQEFRDSELARTISDVYRIQGHQMFRLLR
jgi:heme-degrading monooxygenase HmoA